MRSNGLAVAILGAWVIAQVTVGGALDKLGILPGSKGKGAASTSSASSTSPTTTRPRRAVLT